MTVRAMTTDDLIATLAGHRERWTDAAAYLRRRAPEDREVRRLMLDLEDASRELDDVIGNLRVLRTDEFRCAPGAIREDGS